MSDTKVEWPPRGARWGRVLLVEDQASERRGVTKVLRHAGLDVIEAGTRDGGALALSRERFDLVLLDLTLPDGDGEQLLETVERLRPQPALAVLTGPVEAARSLALQRQGITVLSRPIPPAVVLGLVESLLAGPTSPVTLYAERHGLNPREAEVLRLAARGMLDRDIAEELGCSLPAVSDHWSSILRKTGCQSYGEVLGALARLGERRLTPPHALPHV